MWPLPRVALLVFLGLLMSGACFPLLAQVGLDDRNTVREWIPASRYAVLVGVNDYEKCSDLRYCAADVLGLRDCLVKIGFDERDITVLTDGADIRPSHRNIVEQLDVTLKVADETDLIVVALSGHGAKIGGKSYFCPMDARPDDPEGTMILIEDLYAKLEKCPARLKMVFVDACRNKFLPVDSKPLAEQDRSIDGFARSLSDGVVPKGVALLASCTSGERSWEDHQFGHGVFMHFLLEGLEGKADQVGTEGKKDDRVSLFELCEYVRSETKSHVLRTRRVVQRPYYHTSLDLPDFGLTKVLDIELPENVTNSIGMKLKLIPAGEFLMGSPAHEEDRGSDEQQHRERIAKPFYLGVYEVTQSEYERVMGTNPSVFKMASGRDTSLFPVENVSWEDAVEFCCKLSAMSGERSAGREYRLPTEAEWEYACRAGTTTPFHFGSRLNGSEANCNGKYPYGTETKGMHLERTTTVGSYTRNAFGLYDMHGNVLEWCNDWYDYANSPASDPQGPSRDSYRVIRGGGWNNDARYCRSADRSFSLPDLRFNGSYGFRVALVPAGVRTGASGAVSEKGGWQP